MDRETYNKKIYTKLIELFPNLSRDSQFKITSPADVNYNCIAWACIYNDRWMQPHPKHPYPFDGIFYWPPEARNDNSLEALKEVFVAMGYEECENGKHENGCLKVALYQKNNKWTHAAREQQPGVWCSKMGQSNDISHQSPRSIEGNIYGTIYCFMKRKLK